MTTTVEPEITINGHPLTVGQAMTVRVAVSSFSMQLQDPAFREALGPIAGAYSDRLSEIIHIIMDGK
jgi:hypothetical protein